MSRTPSSLVLVGGVILLVSVFVGFPFAGTANAGDNAAIFGFEPEEIETDPGETVELEVLVSSHGSLRGYGLSEVAFTVSYDPDVVSDAAVEQEGWLGQDDDRIEDEKVNGSTEVDEAAGLVSVAQKREPAGDGVTGHGAVATISLTIEEDADPTNLEVAFESGSAILSTGDPQTVWDNEATVFVDGGVDEDRDKRDDLDGVTLGDDAEISREDEGAAEDESVSAPGFGLLAALLAGFGVGSVLWVGRRFK